MFKSSICLISAIGTIGLLATSMASPARSLPESQILEKLKQIPVFTITNQTRNLIQQPIGKAPNIRQFTPIYTEQRDAQAFIENLRKSGFADSKSAQITIVPLSAIYKLQIEAATKINGLKFVFFPSEQQVKNAGIVKDKPYQSNAFYPIPLFLVAIKQQGKYLTVQENKLTPLFFDRSQAEQWLDRVKKKNPQLVAKAEIKVNYLHVILKDFQTKNYPGQQELVLVPSTQNVALIRKLQAQSNPTTAATSNTSTVTPDNSPATANPGNAKPAQLPATSNTEVPITDKAPSTFITDVQKIVDLIN